MTLSSALAASEEEYNFSWLDPDKKIYVLQNRKFRKAMRPAIFVSGGINLSNPFKAAFLGVPRAAFWFTEQFGVEALYAGLVNRDNQTLKSLRTVNSTALPFVRENRSYYGGLFTWTPWYAKLNFFNQILYLDWFLNGGFGQLNTALDLNRRADSPSNFSTETINTIFVGTGQNFFLTRNFSVRLDLIGLIYQAKGADNLTTNTYTSFDLTAGIGFTL